MKEPYVDKLGDVKKTEKMATVSVRTTRSYEPTARTSRTYVVHQRMRGEKTHYIKLFETAWVWKVAPFGPCLQEEKGGKELLERRS